MAQIFVRKNEPFENALRRFKRKCQYEGILTEIRKREYYESPRVRKKKKEAAAARRLKRKLLE